MTGGAPPPRAKLEKPALAQNRAQSRRATTSSMEKTPREEAFTAASASGASYEVRKGEMSREEL